MLLKVTDADGFKQTVSTDAQEAIINASGTIAATDVSQIAATAASTRSGWLFQNNGSFNMGVNDLGVATKGAGSYVVAPGQIISTKGSLPLSTGAIQVIGTLNDAFTLRTW